MAGFEHSFGSRLRNERIRRGIPLEMIARVTNVPVVLWESLEDGGLCGWPSGVLARAWVADYARLISVDVDETVNEFCRCFPQGDRRRQTILTGVADIVGHQPAVWTDDWRQEERRAPAKRIREVRLASRRAQVTGTIFDLVVAIGLGTLLTALTGIALPIAVVGSGVVYFALSTVSAVHISTYLSRYLPMRRRDARQSAIDAHSIPSRQ